MLSAGSKPSTTATPSQRTSRPVKKICTISVITFTLRSMVAKKVVCAPRLVKLSETTLAWLKYRNVDVTA
jgi:hypothetical protein